MSQSVEIIPTVHETITTTALRIDDDKKITIRQESPDKDNPSTIVTENIQRNYTGLQEGNQIDGTDPVEYIRVTKRDDAAQCIIGVKCYHPENEAEKVPTAGIYWYDPSTHYSFYGPEEDGKSKAPDPESTLTYPIVIFNNSSQGVLPTGNEVVPSWSAETRSLYTLLGLNPDNGETLNAADALKARRNHIRRNLLLHLNNGDWQLILAGRYSYAATSDPFMMTDVRRVQEYMWWIEMMTRAISIDANFDSERKFNLLDGDTSLSGTEIARKINRFFRDSGTGNDITDDRSAWTFRRFGNVPATSPYTYTKPTDSGSSPRFFWNLVRTDSNAGTDAICTLTGADVGDDWTEYLRKIEE